MVHTTSYPHPIPMLLAPMPFITGAFAAVLITTRRLIGRFLAGPRGPSPASRLPYSASDRRDFSLGFDHV